MPFDNTPLETPLPPVNGDLLSRLVLLAFCFWNAVCVSSRFTHRSLAHSGGTKTYLVTKDRITHPLTWKNRDTRNPPRKKLLVSALDAKHRTLPYIATQKLASGQRQDQPLALDEPIKPCMSPPA
jgi:hypothetical protein